MPLLQGLRVGLRTRSRRIVRAAAQCGQRSCLCQPFSTAGKGSGSADERHRIVRMAAPSLHKRKPSTVFGEQVASRAANDWSTFVQSDLEGVGYAFGATAYPAASVSAQFLGERCCWVADAPAATKRARATTGGIMGRFGSTSGAAPAIPFRGTPLWQDALPISSSFG